MPRESFDTELQRLQDDLLDLATMVEEALTESVRTLKARDFAGSRRLIQQDQDINDARFAIETQALALLATQQPIAGDLRMIAAVLDISSELERMGDYAKGIARVNLLIGDQPLMQTIVLIPQMAKKARHMLQQALDALVQRDVALARSIPALDDEVDDLYNQVYRKLINRVIQAPATIEQANNLLWAAHNLERTADRVTNICERIIFTVTGVMEELDVSQISAGDIG
jgi:phosphate transport system protein